MLLIALPRRLLMVSLRGQKEMFCLSFVFFSLDQIPKINICHMVASEHPEVIEGRWRLLHCTGTISDKKAQCTRREFLELFYDHYCFQPIVSFEISNSRDRVRYENRFLVMYSIIYPQTIECKTNCTYIRIEYD